MKSGVQKISIPLDWDKQQILKHNEHMRCSLKWELISWWKQVHNFESKIQTCSRLTSLEWMEMLIRTSFCAFAWLQFASLSLFIYPWRAQRSFNCTKWESASESWLHRTDGIRRIHNFLCFKKSSQFHKSYDFGSNIFFKKKTELMTAR